MKRPGCGRQAGADERTGSPTHWYVTREGGLLRGWGRGLWRLCLWPRQRRRGLTRCAELGLRDVQDRQRFFAVRPIPLKRSVQVRFSRNGELCASISRDVKVLHVAARKEVFTTRPMAHPSNLDFSPDGRLLAVKSTSGRVVMLDSSSGATVTDFENDRDGEGSNILFSACGEFVVDGTWGGVLRVRRQSTGAVIFERDFPNTMIETVCSDQMGETWLTSHAPKITTNGLPAAPAYFLRWSWPFDQAEPVTLRLSASFLRSSAISPDGKFLSIVSGVPAATLQIYSLVNQDVVHAQEVVMGGTGSAVRWSRCSRYLGFVQKGRLSVLELASLRMVRDYAIEFPSAIEFSPDGAVVALGSWSAGRIVSWDED